MDAEDVNAGGEQKREHCYHINTSYIPLKLIYFFFMAGESCTMIYRSVFMRHLGMSTKQAGMIWTLERVVSIVSPPFIGGLTDKTRRPKLVLVGLFIGGAITLSSMYFIPQEDYVSTEIGRPITEEEMDNGEIPFCWSADCSTTSDYAKLCTLSDPSFYPISCLSKATQISQVTCKSLDAKPNTSYPFLPTKTRNASENAARPSYSWCTCHSDTNPAIPKIVVANFELNTSCTTFSFEDIYFGIKSDVDYALCVSNQKNDSKAVSCDVLVPNDVDEYGATFWLLVTLVFISSFAAIGAYPVLEATVIGVLGKENRHKFGQQRVWASVGYGIAALLVGYLKDQSAAEIGVASDNNRAFLSMFVGVFICWLCAAMVSLKLPIKKGRKAQKVRLKDIKIVMKNPKARVFIAALTFYGIDNAVQEVYLFWLAEVKLHSPSFVLGVGTFLGAVMDIPFCLSAGFLIKKFGHAPLFCFGLIAIGVRTMAAALVTNPWQLVATESLRGITWGLTYVVICSYTTKISPKGLENSTMGVVQAYIWGVAYGIGALLGGVLFQSMGGDFLFLLCGVATLVGATLFGIYSLCSRNTEDNKRNSFEIERDTDGNGETFDEESKTNKNETSGIEMRLLE